MGYKNNFIDKASIDLPSFNKSIHPDTQILDYTHFSILFSRERKLPICCAVNINGKKFVQINRSRDIWKTDEVVPDDQKGQAIY